MAASPPPYVTPLTARTLDQIGELIEHCTSEEEPEEAIKLILQSARDLLQADPLKLFVARLERADYVLEFRSSSQSSEVAGRAISIPEPSDAHGIDPFANALRSK